MRTRCHTGCSESPAIAVSHSHHDDKRRNTLAAFPLMLLGIAVASVYIYWRYL